MSIKVSIDASGGDRGIPITITAGFKALSIFKDLQIIFVGDEAAIQAAINTALHKYTNLKNTDRFSIIHANEVILMDESPANALRKKKQSSMRIAIDLVKNNIANAAVSAGNTGALMAISRFVLKTIEGIDRPAIMGRMPTVKGHIHMLDLGANIDSKPEALLEFAIMGSLAVQLTEGIKSPSVGLLNIGEEDMKGNERSKKTNELLKNSTLNYQGFVEGDDIYKGSVDLVVCDGFEGNIALKASEGVAFMMGHYLKQAFNKNLFSKIAGLISKPVLKDFKDSLNPSKYNGASLLGLKGIVIKSHGGANVEAFFQAIKEAYIEAQANISVKIANQVSTTIASQKL